MVQPGWLKLEHFYIIKKNNYWTLLSFTFKSPSLKPATGGKEGGIEEKRKIKSSGLLPGESNSDSVTAS